MTIMLIISFFVRGLLYDLTITGVPIFYPYLLYATSLAAYIVTPLLILLLIFLWSVHNKSYDILVIACLIILPFCGWVAFSAGDYDIDVWGLGLTTDHYQSLRVGNEVFHLVLYKGFFGYGGGSVFRCNFFGLVCRGIYTETWGSETDTGYSTFADPPNNLRLDSEGYTITLHYGENILFQYTLAH
ncbi:MAG: hypothetical protein KF726_21195 [Anaerolineae bacterium]|nr:hypothetical protein [Anaerolineae bacterium]